LELQGYLYDDWKRYTQFLKHDVIIFKETEDELRWSKIDFIAKLAYVTRIKKERIWDNK
jgi:hypothetical protein